MKHSLWYSFLDWLKTASGIHTRYGVVGNRGSDDFVGFVTASQALDWARCAELENPVLFEYDTRERNLPALHRASSRPPRSVRA